MVDNHAAGLKTRADKTGLPAVAIVGARGYSGLELARLLLRHPHANLVGCFATDTGFSLGSYLPESAAQSVPTWTLGQFEAKVKGLHTLFLATPAEVSLELAPKALALGVNVVDLSGAYRLALGSPTEQSANYKKWYGFTHSQTDLLNKAQYGLVPWVGREVKGQGPHLIANPGCYATSVLMAIVPLLKAKSVIPESIVIDAKSGTSGGGRKASENLLFTEVEGECLPYKVGGHQHLPEISETIERLTGVKTEPFFTTHLLNVRRGIISSIYARLTPHFKGSTDQETDLRVTSLFHEAYARDTLVQFAALGTDGGDHLLSLKRVVGSPRTQIAFRARGDKLHVFSLIDNLLKGAAGQAIENFNRLNGLASETGLSNVEGVL
jgi:N-acetyl-gamma-glutamyl-phosphate reductase